MDRINNILQHNQYKKLMNEIKELEKTRIYCKHGLGHCFDVARIGLIIAHEQHINIDKELIYAAALLHDIGRAVQEDDVPHQKHSIRYAYDILNDCGFDKSEINEILHAIDSHNSNKSKAVGLQYILYRADKLSRNCFDCKARETCYWPETEKNKGVIY